MQNLPMVFSEFKFLKQAPPSLEAGTPRDPRIDPKSGFTFTNSEKVSAQKQLFQNNVFDSIRFRSLEPR